MISPYGEEDIDNEKSGGNVLIQNLFAIRVCHCCIMNCEIIEPENMQQQNPKASNRSGKSNDFYINIHYVNCQENIRKINVSINYYLSPSIMGTTFVACSTLLST